MAFYGLLGRVIAGDRASGLTVACGDIGQYLVREEGKRELRASHGSRCGQGSPGPACQTPWCLRLGRPWGEELFLDLGNHGALKR